MLRQRVVYLINFAVIFAFGITAYFVDQKVYPFVQGFYCNDESINFPYPTSSVSGFYHFVVAAGVFIFAFSIVEFFHNEDRWKMFHPQSGCLKGWGSDVFYLILLAIYGSGMTIFITYLCKYVVGRPAPFFLDACKPDWANINCTDAIGRRNYIVGDKFCTNPTMSELKEARLSFPSGCASFSAFVASFICFYMETRFRSHKWGNMPKLFFQILLLCCSLYVGLTDISDNLNHTSDVICGFVIGVFVGYVVYRVFRLEFVEKEEDRYVYPSDEYKVDHAA